MDVVSHEVLLREQCRKLRVQGGTLRMHRRGNEKDQKEDGLVAHHGLDTHIVANIICVAVIDGGAHTRIDDHLEV